MATDNYSVGASPIIECLQIFDRRQANLFVRKWSDLSEIAFARFEIATLPGGFQGLFIDLLFYHPDEDEVLVVLGVQMSEAGKILFPALLADWPQDLLSALASRLLEEVKSEPAQYEIRNLSRVSLPFAPRELTIERVLPGVRDYCTAVNHIKRYQFVQRHLVPGRVIDCASGTGYGASMIMQRPDVTAYAGVDLSDFAVTFARKMVKDVRATFHQTLLSDVDSGLFENVVSLETIEHTTDPQQFLDDLTAKLQPDGQLILSLPAEYWGGSHCNPYHLTNWTFERFKCLVEKQFEECRIFQQKLSLLGPDTFSASEIYKRAPIPWEDECFIAILRKPKKVQRQRIVLKRKEAVGDVIWTTPVLSALRRQNPGADLVVVTDKTEVFMGNPDADMVVTTAFTPNPNDRIIDLDWAYEKNRSLHFLEAYARTASVTVEDPRPRLYPGKLDFYPVRHLLQQSRWAEQGINKIVALHMAATSPDRIWPIENWKKVIKGILADEGVGIILVGHAKDFDFPDLPDLSVDTWRILSLVRRANLLATAAAVQMADLLVAPDSGLAHVAAAVGTRNLVLHGMADPLTRMPLDGSGTFLWTDLECRGCLQDLPVKAAPLCPLGRAQCFERIQPEKVMETVRRILTDIPSRTWLRRARICLAEFSDGEKVSRNPYPESREIAILVEQGQIETAIAKLHVLLEDRPQNPGIHNDLGVLLFQAGEVSKAINSLLLAVRMDPAYSSAQVNLAEICLQLGRGEDAINIFEKLLHENPGDVEILMRLAQISEQLGLGEDAKVFYEKILSIHPENTQAKSSLEVLSAAAASFSEA